MITIRKSPTADTRTCDYSQVTKGQLLEGSYQHIGDVGRAFSFFRRMLTMSESKHDEDKIADIDSFHADFVTGFKSTVWWDKHKKLNRHHLNESDGVPDDVNLIDVLDMIADCVMSGMARSGSVYPVEIPPEVLKRAFDNTVELLKSQVEVKP